MKCLNINIHIEVPTLLLFFAYMSATSVTTNLIIYKTCYVTLGFNESDCALLGKNYTDDATAELEKKVQPEATLVLISLLIIEAIIPPILCFFLGPWTDKYGRKPLLLSGIGGCTLSFLVITIISAIPSASPWFFLLFLVPMCLSGGVPALLTAILCYITDVTNEEYRGVRIGIFEAVMAIGTILGQSSSSFILSACGYVTIYSICTGCVLLAWFYTLIFIPESVQNIENEGKYRNLFNFSLVRETFNLTFKRRENYDRVLLLTLISVMILAVFSIYGDNAVIFLYLRERFYWTLEKFTIFSSITNVTGIIGGFIGVYILHKLLHVNEAIVMVLGFASALIASLVQGFAGSNWLIYAAASSKCLSSAVSPMGRSLLSKLVPTEDSGKVFSIVTALETISALVGSAIYTCIYNGTLITFPAAFNFISAGLHVFEVLAIIGILIMQRNQSQSRYTSICNESNA